MSLAKLHNLNGDQELNELQTNSDDYQNNYQFNRGVACRQFAYLHLFQGLLQTRQRIKQIEEVQNDKGVKEILEAEDVPNIMFEDNAIDMSRNIKNYIQDALEENSQTEVHPSILFKALFQEYKCSIILALLMCFLEAVCRLAFSVVLNLLIIRIISEEQSFSEAYLLAFLGGVIWFIGQTGRQINFNQTAFLVGKIRSALVNLMFIKLTKLSQHTAKSQELGKITNILSNDFNLIELKGPILFQALIVPFLVIGVIVILVIRLGWPGIIGPLVALIMIPIQFYVGKINSDLLKEVNVYKDKRVKVCTEIIEGIRFIKLYGWEIAFKKIIQSLRKKQIRNYGWLSFGRSLERALGCSTATWGGIACFVVMHFTGSGSILTTASIISTLQILTSLRGGLRFFSLGIGSLFQILVIFERLSTILNIQENKMVRMDQVGERPQEIESLQKLDHEIKFQVEELSQMRAGEIRLINFNGYWKKENTPNLKSINLNIKKGGFIGITGKVGSGKSSLLSVFLEEIPFYSGECLKKGTIAYVEQEPVIFSMTIRENILFGAEFVKSRYEDCIRRSCLEADLQLFEDGDQTMVGEKGVTLSGGQRARLALARALYVDADIYLLDDPISAVDSKVAKKIFENVIHELKGEKTLVLVTHQISYLWRCDKVLIMEDGEIIHDDKPESLKEQLEKFQIEKKEESNEEEEMLQRQKLQVESLMKQSMPQMEKESEEGGEKISVTKKEENISVSCQSYLNYIFFSRKNYFLFPITIILFLLAQSSYVIYFRLLAGYDDLSNGKHDLFADNDQLFWGMAGLALFLYFFINVVRFTFLYLVVLISNEKIHEEMIHGLVRSPTSFFDTTPIGQLTNKFSNDLGILDNTLGFTLIDVIEGPLVCSILFANVFAIDIFFIVPGLINLVFLIFFFWFCKKTIVQTKQLDLRLKSPLFSMVNEILSGLVQIKIFNRRKALLSKFARLCNNSLRGNLSFWGSTRVFGTYITYFALIIFMIAMMIGVSNIEKAETEASRQTSAGLYGISIIFLIQSIDYLQWFLRQMINMESIMVSVERSFLMKDLQPEKALSNDYDEKMMIPPLTQNPNSSSEASVVWPQHPSIQIKNFSMRYRPELPLVLKDISFNINEGERVGIVGRTGAGKSSMIQALFRIAEPEEGSMYKMDKVNALQLGLHTLRQRISVIPQTPFLFKGSIKANLDPFNYHTEETLWDVLEKSNLKEAIQRMPEKLETDASNASQVLSVGQKQLLCLARALLRNNRFLVLDEATSNVDMETDRFIQECIRTRFKECTVITIAHRLNTIANYDKIIVMDKGRIAETGSPLELIEKKGMFAEMVQHTGKNAEIIKRIAREAQK